MEWNTNVKAYLHVPEVAAREQAVAEANMRAMEMEDQLSRAVDPSFCEKTWQRRLMSFEDEAGHEMRGNSSRRVAELYAINRHPSLLNAVVANEWDTLISEFVAEVVVEFIAESRAEQLALEKQTGWKLASVISADVYLSTKQIWDRRKLRLGKLYRTWMAEAKHKGALPEVTVDVDGHPVTIIGSNSTQGSEDGGAALGDGDVERKAAEPADVAADAATMPARPRERSGSVNSEDFNVYIDDYELFYSSEDD